MKARFLRTIISLVFAGGLLTAPMLLAGPAQPSTETAHKTALGEDEMTGWKWANFLVLAGVVFYYVGIKHIKPYFAEQTKMIRQGLDEGRNARLQAEVRMAEVQKKLDNLGAQIEELRKSALDEQAELAENLRRRSEQDLQRVWASTAQRIDKIGQNARWELQQFASGLALDLAEKRIRSRMDADLQHALTEQFVRNLKN